MKSPDRRWPADFWEETILRSENFLEPIGIKFESNQFSHFKNLCFGTTVTEQYNQSYNTYTVYCKAHTVWLDQFFIPLTAISSINGFNIQSLLLFINVNFGTKFDWNINFGIM